MVKKGQFYLVAVLIIISIFIGLVTVKNNSYSKGKSTINELEEEINIERAKILDYISSRTLTNTESENILINFSNEYIKRIGSNKNIIFIVYGPTTKKAIGQNLGNDIKIIDSEKTIYLQILDQGEFEEELNLSTEIKVEYENITKSFYPESGQNIYYWIMHDYDNEVNIING